MSLKYSVECRSQPKWTQSEYIHQQKAEPWAHANGRGGSRAYKLMMYTGSDSVKSSFAYSAQMLAALETSLSQERMQTYLSRTGGDQERAIRLYTWNAAVSAAFYGPLQHLEIALRNAMHRELTTRFGPCWYDNAACGFDNRTIAKLATTRSELLRDKYLDGPSQIVASLSFGFWVALLGSGGHVAGSGKANYEMTLWRPALFKAFPHVRISRKKVHAPLDYLRMFRNRIAHHEPVFDRHLVRDYESILEVTGWICPDSQRWISHHSRVIQILNTQAGDTNLRF
jgi:hypothetical protein